MKKLNKQELEALANKIKNEIEAANKEFIRRELDKNAAKNRALRDNLLYDLNNIDIALDGYLQSKMGFKGEDYKKAATVLEYIENKMTEGLRLPFQNKFKSYNNDEVVDALVLAQIEADDLDELISNVKDSFKKEA